MSVGDMVERALADQARDVSAVPDVEALLVRGIRARRRRNAGVLASMVAAAVVLGAILFSPVLWLTADRAPVTPPDVTPAVAPPKNVGIPWGPDVTFYMIGETGCCPFPGGRPFAGTQPWPAVDQVQTFTTTSTGVVYVTAGESATGGPATGEIVFEGWDHQVVVLSRNPRSLPLELGFASRQLWASPLHDLVAWTEFEGKGDGEQVAVVVVRASTGQQLARTVLPGEKAGMIRLHSLDAEQLHAETRTGLRDDGSWDETWVWTWNWAIDDLPMGPRAGTGFSDVAGRTWAVCRETDDGLRFETNTGRLLSRVDGAFRWRPPIRPQPGRQVLIRLVSTQRRRHSDRPNLECDTERAQGRGPDDRVTDAGMDRSHRDHLCRHMPSEPQASISLVTCDVLTLKCTDPIIPDPAAETPEGSDISLPAR